MPSLLGNRAFWQMLTVRSAIGEPIQTDAYETYTIVNSHRLPDDTAAVLERLKLSVGISEVDEVLIGTLKLLHPSIHVMETATKRVVC
jgi:hypothetical protein